MEAAGDSCLESNSTHSQEVKATPPPRGTSVDTRRQADGDPVSQRVMQIANTSPSSANPAPPALPHQHFQGPCVGSRGVLNVGTQDPREG